MNQPRLQPDDPRLTAYALGELDGDERATVEAALRRNPALRSIVDEIRAAGAQLEAALAAEVAETDFTVPASGLNGHAHPIDVEGGCGRAAILPGRDFTKFDGGKYPVAPRGKLLKFPQFYYVVGGFAAACLAVIVGLNRDEYESKQRANAARLAQERMAVESSRDPMMAPPLLRLSSSVETAAAIASSHDAGSTPPTLSRPSPGFVDGNLSLVEQVRQESATQVRMATLPAADRVGVASSPPLPAASSATSGAVGSTAEAVSALSASAPAAIDNPGFQDAAAVVPPADAGSGSSPRFVGGYIRSGATTPADVTATMPGPGPVATPPPASGEVVTLSAFTVTGAHETHGAAMQNNGFGPAEREHLPPAPRGATFGRYTEAYAHVRENDFVTAAQNPLSTFAIDVDTASYANIRRFIEQGAKPPPDAVRIEELLNYFPYRYALPKGDTPFEASVELADAPWAPGHQLVRIGLKGRDVSVVARPAANLVFLLDVSGSMDAPNKLPLVKEAMRLLVGKLRADDHVAIVTYAGDSGLALPSTPVSQSREILNALDRLTPGGSTNGAMGIQLAYEIAKQYFASGINRVILCTDGDFNVGQTSEGGLVRLIEEKAGSGVFLTVLGFGMGNYKDATLEKLANKGNGNYGYIDSRREAEKILVEQVSSTLVTIAKDVKVQVEFNPAKVASYRLIGYENRLLKKEDFNNDAVDAGEIGAGHTVTALYEIVPVGVRPRPNATVAAVDELRYSGNDAFSSRLAMPGAGAPPSKDLLTVKVRFKKPNSILSWPRTLEFPIADAGNAFEKASADFRFAAAVAQFGMILRGSPHKGTGTLGDVIAWAASAAVRPDDDPGGYRGEFIDLVRKTQVLLR